eukprot:724397-Rhodomonas_salina.4
MNLCLRLLNDSGVGYRHACWERSSHVSHHAAFVDDQVLVTQSPDDMNVLLEQLWMFSEWSGMDLCVLKCEATAYHYCTKTELSVDSLHICWKRLTLLAANRAYKYLGVRMTVH